MRCGVRKELEFARYRKPAAALAQLFAYSLEYLLTFTMVAQLDQEDSKFQPKLLWPREFC